jgi:tRNA1Val (adenine37-N6)-methyltransferase
MEQNTILLSPDGLKYTYSPCIAPPGADSFALSYFASETIHDKSGRLCDLGAGGGLISILLASRCRRLEISAVEADERAFSALKANASQPGIPGINTVQGDIRHINSYLGAGVFDFVVSNPPYFKQSAGKTSAQKGSARSDISCGIPDICSAATYLLKNGGKFFMCFRPERLCELFDGLRAKKIEPKVIRPVCHNAGCSPFVLLFECVKGAKPGLKMQKSLFLFTKSGRPTAESDRVYGYAKGAK